MASSVEHGRQSSGCSPETAAVSVAADIDLWTYPHGTLVRRETQDFVRHSADRRVVVHELVMEVVVVLDSWRIPNGHIACPSLECPERELHSRCATEMLYADGVEEAMAVHVVTTNFDPDSIQTVAVLDLALQAIRVVQLAWGS